MELHEKHRFREWGDHTGTERIINLHLFNTVRKRAELISLLRDTPDEAQRNKPMPTPAPLVSVTLDSEA